MKSWRNGFIRCKSRDGPWASHQLDARALKCDTSVGLTDDCEFGVVKDEVVLYAQARIETGAGSDFARRAHKPVLIDAMSFTCIVTV